MFASTIPPISTSSVRRRLLVAASIVLFLASLFPVAISPTPVLASHTPNPASVAIAGSLQSELGCAGDWDPSCAATFLAYDAADDVWQRTFDVPAGGWEKRPPSTARGTRTTAAS